MDDSFLITSAANFVNQHGFYSRHHKQPWRCMYNERHYRATTRDKLVIVIAQVMREHIAKQWRERMLNEG